MKRSNSGVHVFELAFEHTDDILNTVSVVVDICTDVHFTVIRLCGCLSWTLLFWG